MCVCTPETRMSRILLIPMTSARKVWVCMETVIFSLWKMYFSPILWLLCFLLHKATICNAECQRKHNTLGVNGYMHSLLWVAVRAQLQHAACLLVMQLFFILAGPRLGNSPVPSIVQCLARKDGTDDFYQLKVSLVGLYVCFFFLTSAIS